MKNDEKKKAPAQTDMDVKACSMQDCTGLIPNGPVDEETLERYEEIYPVLPQTFSRKEESHAREKTH